MRLRRGAIVRPPRDRWLIPYADFITLLFALFTTLYASSAVDSAKLLPIAEGLQRAFEADRSGGDGVGVLPGGASIRPGGTGVLPAGEGGVDPAAVSTRELIRRGLADDVRAGRVEISEDARGTIVSIPEAGAFAVGSADLSPDLEAVLGRVAAILGGTSDAVRIEGHTDDTPIHTVRFDSNWELSTARATRVVQFFIDRTGLQPSRLSAAGYGEFRPRAGNATPEDRAHNRRVDLVVLTAGTRRREEPPSMDERR
ncbi:MAG: OmpA family protein [Acidobacteria bacterium]|nr:OmpA family protein [Acidobacteriota bacterium]